MAFNLRNRSFLTLADFNTREMEYMLDLAEDLKKAKYAGYEGPSGTRRSPLLALSLRLSCLFQVLWCQECLASVFQNFFLLFDFGKQTVTDFFQFVGFLRSGIDRIPKIFLGMNIVVA